MIEVILCGRTLGTGYDPIYVDQRDKGVTWRMDLWRKASIYLELFTKRGVIKTHKISFALPPFIEVPVPSQKSGQSCICML